jgi:hypothetical protein
VAVELIGRGKNAVKPGMHKREMRRVEKVLDGAECIRAERIWTRVENTERFVVPLGKSRNVVRRLTQRAPHEAVTLLDPMWKRARLERRRRVRVRGDQHAFGLAVVTPAVIGADNGAVDHPAFGELRAAMDA